MRYPKMCKNDSLFIILIERFHPYHVDIFWTEKLTLRTS